MTNDFSTFAKGQIKLLMYSHDALGLGHYRRQLKLASYLRDVLPEVSILLITGHSVPQAFRIPPGIDYVKLPCVAKENNDVYTSKFLPIPYKEIHSIRSRIVLETALAYQPHLFLVDKHPVGLQGELLPTLNALRDRPDTKLVLGLRDILDDPRTMVPYFRTPAIREILTTAYDEIWVYGCRSVFDVIKEYRLTDTVSRKVRFCGYLRSDPPRLPPEEIRRELGIGARKYVLVTVGGGEDGMSFLDTYLQALDLIPKQMEVFSLLVTGPDMSSSDQAALRRRLDQRGNGAGADQVAIVELTPQLHEHMASADLVVCMAGYNTLSEVLSLGKKAVVIPRIVPRLEQLVRAEAFARRGLISLVHPYDLSPRVLAETVVHALHRPAQPDEAGANAEAIEFNGLESAKNHILRLLES